MKVRIIKIIQIQIKILIKLEKKVKLNIDNNKWVKLAIIII
jgi:hypothetical protein